MKYDLEPDIIQKMTDYLGYNYRRKTKIPYTKIREAYMEKIFTDNKYIIIDMYFYDIKEYDKDSIHNNITLTLMKSFELVSGLNFDDPFIHNTNAYYILLNNIYVLVEEIRNGNFDIYIKRMKINKIKNKIDNNDK